MNTRSLRHLCLAVFAFALVVMVAAKASAIPMVIQPVSATATSEFATRTDAMTVDGSGLSLPGLVTTGSPIPVVWPTHGTVANGEMWLTFQVNPGVIVFDLGASYTDLIGFHVWNYNQDGSFGNRNRGMENVTVTFSTDNITFGSPIVYSGVTAFANASASQIPGPTLAILGEDKLFPQITARYIRFSGFRFPTGNSEGHTGLSEVRFFTTFAAPEPSAVPEPSTFAVLGLGMFGLAIRHRRRRTAA